MLKLAVKALPKYIIIKIQTMGRKKIEIKLIESKKERMVRQNPSKMDQLTLLGDLLQKKGRLAEKGF